MTIPSSTYRIQFRNGMTFDRVAERVGYLQRLGITHLYASPIFTAASGSTHGYDIVNPNEIDPVIGGREGFDRMVTALQAAGLGLILDIVPNHLAATLDNPWWRDVVQHGAKSRFAGHFDIDWSRRLTLPVLSDSVERLIVSEEITLRVDPGTGEPALAYHDSFYPLSPETASGLQIDPQRPLDAAAITAIHNRQPYRLMNWRDAASDLSYRRFFEITSLAGMRVEDDAVFDDMHRLVLDLVLSGVVDGLRIDHLDGLADPEAYLKKLRGTVGPDCYLTVEKILGENEEIPETWPISGTTGYEFISTLSDALVDDDGIQTLRRAYDEAIGRKVDMTAELRSAKLQLADVNFAGEFSGLLQLAMRIAETEAVSGGPSEDLLRSALRELLVAFPVYRTYGTRQGLGPQDRQRMAEVMDAVRRGPAPPPAETLEFLDRILAGKVSDAATEMADRFRVRFQQLTGPLMAKSVEDTLFYRQNMLLAINEVGEAPLPRPFSVSRFHARMATRLRRQPDALSATATHDTKRGEDARARLYALSEAPEDWAKSVGRWRGMNAANRVALKHGPAPEPQVEWMLYQALAGAWPTDLDPADGSALSAFEERFIAYVEKALREASLRTDWGAVDETYENSVKAYASALLSPSNQAFLTDFAATLSPLVAAGLQNSLTQTIIKLTAPGVPDIYQGSEQLDFSLVDPDNRREPDFARLQNALEDGADLEGSDIRDWESGKIKQNVIGVLLRLRRNNPDLFRRGDYRPLMAVGAGHETTLAYARVLPDATLLVVVPRQDFGRQTFDTAAAQTVTLDLAPSLSDRVYRDVFSGKIYAAGARQFDLVRGVAVLHAAG